LHPRFRRGLAVHADHAVLSIPGMLAIYSAV
jgi:hypothetical protein